ncbi:MAG: hypothetical protein M1830_002769 [Pleopsidium flavum]|nr:MAG: hypothetical protein M1830_002769 [Pleopsidium flavum]
MTGFLSSIPGIVVVGSIEDLFDSKARVWLIFVWLTIANSGLVIGPISSSYISSSIGWRWVFYITAAIAGLSALLLLAIRESRASQLLERRVCAIRKATGDSSLRIQTLDHAPNLRTFIRLALFRPLYLLFTEPIVLMVSIMSAIAFGLIYLFTEVLPIVYGSYGFTVQQTSLAFIPIGIGLVCCVFTRLYDRNLIVKRGKSGQSLSPENKLTGFAIAAPALAIGLWWFAWTIPPAVPHVPWVVSMFALILIGFAINEFDCVLVGYLADSCTNFASSAYASLSLLRSIFSAVFPLFASQMYTTLGANYASTILAAVATVACVSPFLLIRYGEQIRQASKFARYSLAVNNENGADGGEADGDIEIIASVIRN